MSSGSFAQTGALRRRVNEYRKHKKNESTEFSGQVTLGRTAKISFELEDSSGLP
jgi:hypothetical protein